MTAGAPRLFAGSQPQIRLTVSNNQAPFFSLWVAAALAAQSSAASEGRSFVSLGHGVWSPGDSIEPGGGRCGDLDRQPSGR